MKKMPCSITDEVISNDPQDAPEAVYKDYNVYIPIKGWISVKCSEINKQEAIIFAKETFTVTDIEVEEFIDSEIEVEEI